MVEEEIDEKIRESKVRCSQCGSLRTILKPIDVDYRLTKECGPKIPGYKDKPFIGEATKLTNDLFKDCTECNARERAKPEDVKYYIDGYLGMKE